MNLKFGI